MKFITDINITNSVIGYLRQQGYNVLDIKKINPTIPDREIIKIAKTENRIILTHDKDFLTLTKYPKYQAGTILIRLIEQNSQHFIEKLKQLLKNKTDIKLIKSLTIITEESTESYPY